MTSSKYLTNEGSVGHTTLLNSLDHHLPRESKQHIKRIDWAIEHSTGDFLVSVQRISDNGRCTYRISADEWAGMFAPLKLKPEDTAMLVLFLQ